MEDEKIVQLYWDRDERAIQETADKYGKYCFSIAYNILTDTEDAKESVNDTYLNAWNRMPPHRPSLLSAFLGKITRFICLKKWRSQHTKKRSGARLVYEELSECIPAQNGLDDRVDAKEIAKIIEAFLHTLPTADRRVFVCRYWYFDPISTIAERFGFSESKVKSMLHRTRKKLYHQLKKEGVVN